MNSHPTKSGVRRRKPTTRSPKNSTTTEFKILSFDEAVAILRDTGTNMSNAGTLSKGDLVRQELRIKNLTALQATVQRFAAKVPPDRVTTPVETQIAVRMLREDVRNRCKNGTATMRDVAEVELRLIKLATLAALAYQLSEMKNILFVADPRDDFEQVQSELFSEVKAQAAAGTATNADLAEALLTIAEARFLRQVAYGL